MTKAQPRVNRPTDLTIDHIVAIVRSGLPLTPTNRIWCCRKCNSLKGETSSEQFQSFVSDYGAVAYRAAAEASLRCAYKAFRRRPPAASDDDDDD